MIHPETHLVTKDHGPRPAGKADECFYCRRKIGDEHAPECVVRERTVVVRMTIEYVTKVPEHWDTDGIDFHYNDSSWCASNALNELAAINNRGVCVCGHAKFEFVREATEDDVDLFYPAPEELPTPS
jgi:hypothetical protein